MGTAHLRDLHDAFDRLAQALTSAEGRSLAAGARVRPADLRRMLGEVQRLRALEHSMAQHIHASPSYTVSVPPGGLTLEEDAPLDAFNGEGE